MNYPEGLYGFAHLGFDVPNNWIWGICNGCGQRFQPKLSKQYWCEPCRSEPIPVRTSKKMPSTALILPVGFFKKLLPKDMSLRQLAEKIGYSLGTLQGWSQSGYIPAGNGSDELLCKALGMTREQVIEKCERKTHGGAERNLPRTP